MYNLMETGHEAGIIVYQDDSIAVYNWSNISDNTIPMLSPFGMPINRPENVNEGDEIVHICSTDDVREYLPGTVTTEDGELTTDMDVVYDECGDIPALFGFGQTASAYVGVERPYSGSVWKLPEGQTVITLDLWN